MRPQVYLETTIISYQAAWSSRDLIVAAHQQITQEWWSKRREDFSLYVSELVIEEAAKGDPSAAKRRLDFLEGDGPPSPRPRRSRPPALHIMRKIILRKFS